MSKRRCDAALEAARSSARPPTISEALFLIPARLTRPFFSRLYAECEARIFAHFKEEVRPVVRAVSSVQAQFDAKEVTRILEREFRMNSGRIKFLIVVPTDSSELSLGVSEVIKSHNIPTIALTLPFHGWPSSNGSPAPPKPPSILCKSAEGTRELGRAASIELRRKGVHQPRVWVMPGSRRIDSLWRIRGFLRGLRDEGATPSQGGANHLPSANWLRQEAAEIMRKAIAQESQPVDVVFAANDEMALGVRDSIREACRNEESAKVVADCLIYGFDGIAEARSLIEKHNGDKWLKGTVVQDFVAMASKLVEVMEQFRAGKNVLDDGQFPTRVVLHPQMEEDVQASNAYPDHVPPLTSNKFIPEAGLIKQGRPSKHTLATYRRKGVTSKDDFGTIGKDSRGMIYRIDAAGSVFYLISSVDAVNNRKRAKRRKG